MSYRTGRGMAAEYMRVGPDGQDLTRTRATDQAATDRLLGSSLAVLRVSVDQSGEQPVLVVWRNAPSPDDIAAAEAILGFSAQHSS